MLQNYVKNDGTNLIFTGHYMEFYIPEYYFENSYAVIYGSSINVLGLLHYSIFDAKDKELEHNIMNLPTFITMFFKDIKKKEVTLSKAPNAKPEPCRVIPFYKNDHIMESNLQKDSSNVEKFLKMLCAGKIRNIPYDKLFDVWEKNLQLNNVRFGAPGTVLEIIIAQLCRNADNIDEKFSVQLNRNPKTSMYAYKAASIKELCSKSSTFAAISFQDMDFMLTSSLNMNKYHKDQSESPLEKIMKY